MMSHSCTRSIITSETIGIFKTLANLRIANYPRSKNRSSDLEPSTSPPSISQPVMMCDMQYTTQFKMILKSNSNMQSLKLKRAASCDLPFQKGEVYMMFLGTRIITIEN